MSLYGYIRVSSRDQNEDRQIMALSQFPIPEKNIYIDKKSGKDFNRPAYRRLLRRLKPGDLHRAMADYYPGKKRGYQDY